LFVYLCSNLHTLCLHDALPIFNVCEQLVERGAIQKPAIYDDRVDLLGITDILERVGGEQHQISDVARFYCTCVFHTEKPCRIAGGCLQRLHGGKASLDKIGKLVVQTESGHDVDSRCCVGSCHKGHSGAVESADHLKISCEVFPTQCEWIVYDIWHHLLCEAAPGDVPPVGRNVAVERLVLQVALVTKRASALPGERGHLPGLALSKQLHQTVALLRVRGAQQQLQIPFTPDEAILLTGAALEEPHQP